MTSAEFDRFVETLDGVPPTAVTACEGWTTHDVVAHLTSGVELLSDRFEAHLDARPMPESADWPTLHARYCDIDDVTLRRRLIDGEQRLGQAFDRAAVSDAESWPLDVGWGMPVDELRLHFRVEYALHRWDLIGDDEINDRLLAQPELLGHSVRMLSAPLLEMGAALDPEPDVPLEVIVRVADHDDLLLVRGSSGVDLELTEVGTRPAGITCDAAARLLLVWGRRPADATRIHSALPSSDLLRCQRLLSGF